MSRGGIGQRRISNSANSESHDKMGDQRLVDFLNECTSADEAEVNLKSHGQTFANTQELQNATFRLLLRDHQRDQDVKSLELLKSLCHFMLSLYRTTTSGPKLTKNSFIPTSTANDMLRTRVIVLQYLPHFINLHLLTRCRNHRYNFLDAFLLSLYNIEASEQQALRLHLASVNTVPNNPLHRPLIVKVNIAINWSCSLDFTQSYKSMKMHMLEFEKTRNAAAK